jgi:Dimerisation domain
MSENIPVSPEGGADPWKLLQMMQGYWITQALYVAAKLGIADLLREGPVSCNVLAGKTSTHPQSLYRTLRARAPSGIAQRSSRRPGRRSRGESAHGELTCGSQKPRPKCRPNVTGSVAGPPTGRLNRTGNTASTKYALKKPSLPLMGQLLFTRGVNPYCGELTSNAARTPAD